MENYSFFFRKKYYFTSLINSMVVCTLATIFSTIIGVPMAYIITRYNIPAKGIFYVLIIMSLLAPPVIGAYSWIILLGNNGIIVNFLKNFGTPTLIGQGYNVIPVLAYNEFINEMGGNAGLASTLSIIMIFGEMLVSYILVIAYVLRKLPYTIRSSVAILYQVDKSVKEASINLGVPPLKTFFKVTVPIIATAVYSEVFASNFGTGVALASILTFTTIISLLIVNKLSGKNGIRI